MKRSLLVLVLFTLSGCISIGGGSKENSSTSVYTLHPRDGARSGATRGTTVVLEKPELPADLAGERIALRFGQGQQDFYADARWSSRLEDLLQEFLTRAARRDLHGVIVAEPGSSSAAYRLTIKVTEFGPVYPGNPDTVPQLKVGLALTVVALPAGTAVAQFTVQKAAPAGANTLTAVTKGLDAVLDSAADEVFTKAAGALHPNR